MVLIMRIGHQLNALSTNQKFVVFNPYKRKSVAAGLFEGFIDKLD
jgi:hypothetical protein